MAYKITEIDPYLTPFTDDLELRMNNYKRKRQELLGVSANLVDFSNAYKYFGFHRLEDGWYTANGHLPQKRCILPVILTAGTCSPAR